MNGMSKLRLFAYLVGAGLSIAAAMAASAGLGTYDPATGYFDPHPIPVEALATLIVTGLTNALAALALWRGWGK
jgi:hypothetical protein